jgi:hypothetical protein
MDWCHAVCESCGAAFALVMRSDSDDPRLRRPFGRGIRRHVDVNDATPSVTQDDKHDQQLKPNGRHDERIHTNHVRHMILDLDEGSPGLR